MNPLRAHDPVANERRYARPRSIHVVCPRRDAGCGNDAWENMYHAATAHKCGRHPGGRIGMVCCPECLQKPGTHRPPDSGETS